MNPSNWRQYLLKGWGILFLIIALATVIIEYKEQDLKTLVAIVIFQLMGACIIYSVMYLAGFLIEKSYKKK